jgi:hypothetical protein
MSSESVCQVARSWVDVGSFYKCLVVRFMIFTASVRNILDWPVYFLITYAGGGGGLMWVRLQGLRRTGRCDTASLPQRMQFGPRQCQSHCKREVLDQVSLQLSLTNHTMLHSPFTEADSSSASHKIPLTLWNPEFRYCSQKPAIAPVLRQINPVRSFPPCIFQTNFNTVVS